MSILIGDEARQKIMRGAKTLCDVVATTIGPKGRNVVLDGMTPTITNDGVTIANAVKLDDKYENLGAEILRMASRQTNQSAGDGTTSVIVLANEILTLANKQIMMGESPVTIRDQLLRDAKTATDLVEKIATPCDTYDALLSVTTNSCANPEDGELIARAITRVGTDGVVIVEENTHGATTLTLSDGLQCPLVLASPYFAQDPTRLETTLCDATIHICDDVIKSLADILPTLETAREKALVIIAPDFAPDVVAALVLNRVRGGLNVVALRANCTDPKPLFDDIRAVHAEKIIASVNCTKFIAGKDSAQSIADRADQIRGQMLACHDEYMLAKLKNRLARLTTGVATISVGHATQIETHERKLRIDDALHAGTHARRDGTVLGGGVTYLNIAKKLGDGRGILSRALSSITRQIAQNENVTPDVVIKRVKKSTQIIDPATVIKSVITNATSVAATLITTEAIVLEKPN